MIKWLVAMCLLAAIDAAVAGDCAAIENDHDRLACYDAMYKKPPPQATRGDAAVAAAAPPAVQPAPMPSAAEEFGLTAAQREVKREPERPAQPDILTAHVVAVAARPNDRFVLTLDNGQKWAQIEPTVRQRFFAGDSIAIRKSMLDSYLASGPNSGNVIRVRRVE